MFGFNHKTDSAFEREKYITNKSGKMYSNYDQTLLILHPSPVFKFVYLIHKYTANKLYIFYRE
jgi:hypothetical protein